MSVAATAARRHTGVILFPDGRLLCSPGCRHRGVGCWQRTEEERNGERDEQEKKRKREEIYYEGNKVRDYETRDGRSLRDKNGNITAHLLVSLQALNYYRCGIGRLQWLNTAE